MFAQRISQGMLVGNIKATYLAFPSGWRGKGKQKGELRKEKGEIICSWICF